MNWVTKSFQGVSPSFHFPFLVKILRGAGVLRQRAERLQKLVMTSHAENEPATEASTIFASQYPTSWKYRSLGKGIVRPLRHLEAILQKTRQAGGACSGSYQESRVRLAELCLCFLKGVVLPILFLSAREGMI